MLEKSTIGFSIIMPSFNQGCFIAAALDSIINQDYPLYEIIVLDACSTDNTPEVLRQYEGKISLICEPDNGQADAIQKGFKLAKYEWITWLNSDDIQCGMALHEVAKIISSQPDVEVVIGDGHYMDQDGHFLRAYPTVGLDKKGGAAQEFFDTGYVAQPSVYFLKEAYNRIGGVDANLGFVMDYELWMRFAVNDCKFARLHKDISGNRWYNTTKTASQILPLYVEAIKMQKKLYNKVSPYFVQAVSDYIHHLFKSQTFDIFKGATYVNNEDVRMLTRAMTFKFFWIFFNYNSKFSYFLRGLFFISVAKSSADASDRLSKAEFLVRAARAIKYRLHSKRSIKN